MLNLKKFNNITTFYLYIIFLAIIIISIFEIPFLNKNNIKDSNLNIPITQQTLSLSGELCWPLPGYTRISSPFGYRNSPTAGATSFHGGVDLPAPPGTNIISAITGKVTYTGFMGSGGCTVVVENSNYTVIFHHICPDYLVRPGDFVNQGQVIAQVGPKNVYGFANNPYRDGNRKSN